MRPLQKNLCTVLMFQLLPSLRGFPADIKAAMCTLIDGQEERTLSFNKLFLHANSNGKQSKKQKSRSKISSQTGLSLRFIAKGIRVQKLINNS